MLPDKNILTNSFDKPRPNADYVTLCLDIIFSSEFPRLGTREKKITKIGKQVFMFMCPEYFRWSNIINGRYNNDLNSLINIVVIRD